MVLFRWCIAFLSCSFWFCSKRGYIKKKCSILCTIMQHSCMHVCLYVYYLTTHINIHIYIIIIITINHLTTYNWDSLQLTYRHTHTYQLNCTKSSVVVSFQSCINTVNYITKGQIQFFKPCEMDKLTIALLTILLWYLKLKNIEFERGIGSSK